MMLSTVYGTTHVLVYRATASDFLKAMQGQGCSLFPSACPDVSEGSEFDKAMDFVKAMQAATHLFQLRALHNEEEDG